MRDDKRTNEQTLKIELLSQWKLEAEFRNDDPTDSCWKIKKQIGGFDLKLWLSPFALFHIPSPSQSKYRMEKDWQSSKIHAIRRFSEQPVQKGTCTLLLTALVPWRPYSLSQSAAWSSCTFGRRQVFPDVLKKLIQPGRFHKTGGPTMKEKGSAPGANEGPAWLSRWSGGSYALVNWYGW